MRTLRHRVLPNQFQSIQLSLKYLTLILLAGLPFLIAVEFVQGQERVDFVREIQPIFTNHCISCHGATKAAGRLRLDVKTLALKGGVSGPAIAPGASKQSLLLTRILGLDGQAQMPMGGDPLSKTQIETIRKWIDEGATWPDAVQAENVIEPAPHWAFIAPKKQQIPTVNNSAWVKNPIDHFVLAKLEKLGIQPAPAADRTTLLRRVSLDLTGLPPSLAELDAFLADSSPNAYEKAVDRLLASPRYGERMAFRWLDAARYADTNGYQIDGDRSAWRWRDWVIQSFNQNMPFDQFVIEQLAGDLLPNPTLNQRIATAFNRNHRINAEGGIVPEEYRNEYVVDRVDTTSTVFMGLTVGCARCHNHKYDPITQKEYYQLAAFFNSIDEDGHSFDYGNSPPLMLAPTNEQQAKLDEYESKRSAILQQIQKLSADSLVVRKQWEKQILQSEKSEHWFPSEKMIVHIPFGSNTSPNFYKSDRAYHAEYNRGKDEKLIDFPVGIKEGQAVFTPSPVGEGLKLDGKRYFDAGIHADFRYRTTSSDYKERFSISTWFYPEAEQSGSLITKVSDSPAEKEGNIPRAEGYGLYFLNGKLHFNMVFRWGEDTLRVETKNPIAVQQWHHVAVVFDGTRHWEERIHLYVDGIEQPLQFNQRNFFLLFGGTKNTLKIGAGGGPEYRFKGAVDEVRMYSRTLSPDEISVLACADPVNVIAAIPDTQRTKAQSEKLFRAFVASGAVPDLQTQMQNLAALNTEELKFRDQVPTLMVMEEMPQPRPTFVLRRGAYDAPAEAVKRATPQFLNHFPANQPLNRLGFARWLVSPQHPLTARVAVNRYWQMFFGEGLVRTTEDFGTQGEPPTHPELLDWLAVEFMNPCAEQHGRCEAGQASQWDIKRLLKLIVTSATYRQASQYNPKVDDPTNRLLARGARFRLSPEMLRDQALFVSDLLVEKVGGPSVKPYQPDGLYKDMAFGGLTNYAQANDEGLWRRSLYTYWKRTVLNPTMQVFDASAREFCTVRDTRTNTPLQALNLMNDVTYLEAARLLAQRMLSMGAQIESERLRQGFRLVTSRYPTARELEVLQLNLAKQRTYYNANQSEAKKILAVGVKRNDSHFDDKTLAAYTAVASLLLNLDEAITRQ